MTPQSAGIRHAAPRASGFTLLEMLLAVIIIAVVGITVSTAIGSVANQTHALERRTVAHWISLNQMTRVRLDLQANPRVLPEGKDTVRVFMAQREWEVQTTVTATDQPILRRVELDVYELVDGRRAGPYDHLAAFVGRK